MIEVRCALAVLAQVLAGCTAVNELELEFHLDWAERPSGFSCMEDAPAIEDACREGVGSSTPRYLVDRAFDEGSACLVVDLLEVLGGHPSCLSSDIGSFCWAAGHSCVPIAGTRRYLQLQLPVLASGSDRWAELVRAMDEQDGFLLSSNTPDSLVVVRVVGTTEPCDNLPGSDGRRFNPASLIGCSHTCALRLDDEEGALSLFGDYPCAHCENAVQTCAETGRDTAPAAGAP